MTISELIISYPIYAIIIISFIATFVSTLITKWLVNQENLKNIKKRQKEIQTELKNCKDDCKLKELNAEMMQLTASMFKDSFKPLIITMVPFLILFYWMSSEFAPLISGKFLFPMWIWYYLGASIVASILYRKLLKMA
ncbi:MAG: EMC3/TMCO1 family protein [Nanoarchaeota archaeon]|nr:EMC3/TMCO1 family protein [Nanoarchaeota archaeon]